MDARWWSRWCSRTALAASVCAAGIGLAAAARRPVAGRRAHHALFGAVCVASATAASLAPSRARVRPLLALAVLPLTRAGSPAHTGTGVTVTALLTLAALSP